MAMHLNRDEQGRIRGYITWQHSLNLVDSPTRYNSVLIYDPADPFAVTLRLWCGDSARVDWVISRDVLLEGVQGELAGIGDYSLGRIDHFCLLMLDSPSGQLSLTCVAAHLEEFLDAAAGEVPFGAEDMTVDIDDALAWLMRESA